MADGVESDSEVRLKDGISKVCLVLRRHPNILPISVTKTMNSSRTV